MKTIDLNKYVGQRSNRIYVLSGKDRGLDVRNALNLDELERIEDSILVEVPADLHRMTPSFILGLFSKTLESLSSADRTKEEVILSFFDKYRFITAGAPADRIKIQIEESIDDFFRSESSLSDFISGFKK